MDDLIELFFKALGLLVVAAFVMAFWTLRLLFWELPRAIHSAYRRRAVRRESGHA